jgi:hypothetical protein
MRRLFLLAILIISALCLLVAIKQTVDDRMGISYICITKIEKVYSSFWSVYWQYSLYNLLDVFTSFRIYKTEYQVSVTINKNPL